MEAVALALGVLIGSLPTADWIAAARGVDLRAEGTGNPGANNAFRTGGVSLGASVLAVEAVKGIAAVWLGATLSGSGGAASAGAGATVGNVYNPWFGLRGGKGLSISGGTLLAAQPVLALGLILVTAFGALVIRRSGPVALAAIGIYLALTAAGMYVSLPGPGFVESSGWLLVMAVAQAAVMAPKHAVDAFAP